MIDKLDKNFHKKLKYLKKIIKEREIITYKAKAEVLKEEGDFYCLKNKFKQALLYYNESIENINKAYKKKSSTQGKKIKIIKKKIEQLEQI